MRSAVSEFLFFTVPLTVKNLTVTTLILQKSYAPTITEYTYLLHLHERLSHQTLQPI